MLDPITMTFASVIVVSLISFIGVATLALKEKIGKVVLYFVAFAAGALIGDAFIHILPNIVETGGFGPEISLYIISGIIISFIVEKIIHWKHKHAITSKGRPQPFAYMNLFGDAVHNFIDGLVIAASYLISVPVGVATTIAVIFHEIPQEIGDFGVLVHGGFSRKNALFANFLSALLAVGGAAVAISLGSYTENSIRALGAFAVGGFIYIAGTDLMPELHRKFSTKGSVAELGVMLLGIAVMYALLLLE